jgi:hypothetical protein
MSNDITSISAKLALADAVLAAVKESGLARVKRRRVVARRRRTTKAAQKPRTSRTPLKNVPAEAAA